MRILAIHRRPFSRVVFRAYLVDERRSFAECVEQAARVSNKDQVVTCYKIDDEIAEAVEFLVEDRIVEKESLLNAVNSLVSDLDSLIDDARSVFADIREHLSENTEK